MSLLFFFCICIGILLLGGYFVFLYLSEKISLFEKNIIRNFSSRTDLICQLYEVSKYSLWRHQEIFAEVLNLRKQEFSLIWISQNLEGFLQIEEAIHHEINFIFQVCNKSPELWKNKRFLYVREVMLEKSNTIGKEMKNYRKIIEIYNSFIRIKNYTLIGFLLPFSKKVEL